MDALNIENFNPAIAELLAMAEESKQVTITDFEDPKQVEAVRQQRIKLKNVRVQIEKKGKELRDDAVKFQKAVIAKENELVSIIEPEEERLKVLEDEAKTYALRQERARKLPERQKRLSDAGVGQNMTDDQINDMDDVTFENRLTVLVNEKLAADNAAKQAELDARQAEIDRKERLLQEQEDAKEREAERLAMIEQARLDGIRQAEEAQKRKEDQEKALAEQVEAEKKANAIKMEREKKSKAFLASHGWTQETRGEYKTEETPTGYVLYKRLGEFVR